mmetsp:Transcript_28823/g.49206  ORF Transcript_28823/g.49206 Transcript_28823/m.49206 type:complete len:291 (-) Transcript_28823:138-1010(-)
MQPRLATARARSELGRAEGAWRDGAGVHEQLPARVAHDAEVAVVVDELDCARGRAAVPRKQFPHGAHGHFYRPDQVCNPLADVARQRSQPGEAGDGARRRVLHLHGQPASLIERGRRGGDHAAAEGGQQLPEAQHRDDRQGEQVGVKLRVEHAVRGIDGLGNPADLGDAPRAGLELVESEEEVRLLGGACRGVRLLDCEEEGGRAEDAVLHVREDKLPLPCNVLQPRGQGRRLRDELFEEAVHDAHAAGVRVGARRVVALPTIQSRSELEHLHFELSARRDGGRSESRLR